MRHVVLRVRARRRDFRGGLTLVEVIATMVCLAIAAAIVIPVATDNSGDRLRGAARMLAADLEYAQSESMSHGDNPRLFVIDADKGGYRITTQAAPTVPITNKVGGDSYVTRYGSARAAALTGVKVGTYNLGGDDRIAFGTMGQLDQTTAATIQLVCGPRSIQVSVDPTTGEVSIGTLQ